MDWMMELELDQIFIRQLHMHAIVGVHPEERLHPQPILLDAILYTKPIPPNTPDRLDQVVDYAQVTNHIQRVIEQSQFHLVEQLLAHLASCCFELDHRIQAVTLSLSKPNAIPNAQAVGCTIHRRRQD